MEGIHAFDVNTICQIFIQISKKIFDQCVQRERERGGGERERLTIYPSRLFIPSRISRSMINKRLLSMASERVSPSRKGFTISSLNPNLKHEILNLNHPDFRFSIN